MYLYLLVLLSVLVSHCSAFYLHKTEYNNEDILYNISPYQDCIYAYKQESNSAEILIPYCRRNHSNNVTRISSCGNQTSLSFLDMRNSKVTQQDLYNWFAPIDIQDAYAKYLEETEDTDDKRVYCNCSSPWFGISCEYHNKQAFSLMLLVEEQFQNKSEQINLDLKPILTCYEGLTACQTDGLCLDWRQVCNGILDCTNGEDEQDCLEMELNRCDEKKEYRCRNGLCISREFLFDFFYDCLDRSDEEKPIIDIETKEVSCFHDPSINCEEFMSAWMQTSCGDGDSVVTPLHTCHTKRTLEYHQYFLHPYLDANKMTQCTKLMICAIDIDAFHALTGLSSYICKNHVFGGDSKQLVHLIRVNCPEKFVFPAKFILQPPVRFVYVPTMWKNPLPQFVCYETNEACPLYPPIMTIIIDSMTLYCRNTTDYPLHPTINKFIALFSVLQQLLSYCKSNINNNVTNDLFLCKTSQQYLSPTRILDGFDDCILFDYEDETHELSICPSNIPDRFLCKYSDDVGLNKTICLPRTVIFTEEYKQKCSILTPELKLLNCQKPNEIGCRFIRGEISSIQNYFIFQEVCNGLVHANWSIDEGITDETACLERQEECTIRFGKCNGIWDCTNGIDEINCPQPSIGEHQIYNSRKKCAFLFVDELSQLTSNDPEESDECNDDEHYCYHRDEPYKRDCLNIVRAGDGRIDCIGGTDERLSHCPILYPNEYDRRFRCLDSSLCIPIHDVCDGQQDCPLGDDEWPCPSRKDWNCPINTFPSSKPIDDDEGSHCLKDEMRCTNQIDEKIFCDLITRQRSFESINLIGHAQYPPRPDRIVVPKVEELPYSFTSEHFHSQIQPISECRRGFALDSGQCLCPASYYGSECEFQAERLTVILQIDLQPSVYNLQVSIITFIIRIDQTTHYEYINHFHQQHGPLKHIVYLLMPFKKRPLSVRIDAFLVTSISVQHQEAWLFDLSFPFLPVNRLARKLIVGRGRSSSNCLIPCIHGACMIYANSPSIRNYCLCMEGWTGSECNMPSKLHCAKHAKELQGICVCPLGHFGSKCFATFNPCQKLFCQNSGQCIPLDIRIAPGYICQCSSNYFGRFCEKRAATALIHMPNKGVNEQYNQIPCVVAYLLDIDSNIGLLALQDRLLFENVPYASNLSIVYSNNIYIPTFIFVQILTSANILYQSYHLVSLAIRNNRAITSSILQSNYCPYVGEVLDNQIMQQSYIIRIKYYHRLCFTLETRCFYDEQHMCFCDKDVHFDCLIFDHNEANCSNENICQNGAYCLQARQKKPPFDFACVCRKCYYGKLCQFTTIQYSISLDVLSDENNTLEIFLVAFSLIIIGLITNSFTLMVFRRIKSREGGCRLYLLSTSLVAHIGLIMFAVKFIILLLNFNTLINCIIIEYLLSVLPSIFDWLTVCIAIERMFIAIRGPLFNRIRSFRLAKIVILVIIMFNLLAIIHKLFYRQMIKDPRVEEKMWCTMQLPTVWLSIYDKSINIFNLIMPFFLNIITIFILIRSIIIRKLNLSSSAAADTYSSIFIKQFRIFKSFIISPIVLLLLGLPRLVFTFTFACITKPWQKYMYLASYMLGCIPYMSLLFIYICPSEMYLNELKKLFIQLTNCFRKFFNINK